MCLCEVVSVGFWVRYTAIQIFSGSLYVIVRLLLIRMKKQNKTKNKYLTGCSKVQENKSWAKPASLFIIAFNHLHNSILINLFTGEDVRPITQLDWYRPLITRDVKWGIGVTGQLQWWVWSCTRTHTHTDTHTHTRMHTHTHSHTLTHPPTLLSPILSNCDLFGKEMLQIWPKKIHISGEKWLRKPVLSSGSLYIKCHANLENCLYWKLLLIKVMWLVNAVFHI